jgi:hypothetical protein
MFSDGYSIGGEFQISPSFFNVKNYNDNKDKKAFSSGRSAFRAILKEARKLGFNEIWLPNYICDTVPASALQEMFALKWYEIEPNFHIKLRELQKFPNEPFLILLVDYFGMLDLSNEVSELHKAGAVVCIDKIQALYEPDSFGADYWFYGFRKFLPIPEGAFAFSRNEMIIPPQLESDVGTLKVLAGLIKNIAYSYSLCDEAYLNLFNMSEQRLDCQEEITSTGPLFPLMLSSIDIEEAKVKRQKNYEILSNILQEYGIQQLKSPEKKRCSPLAIPIAIQNRDAIRKYLISKHIYLPVHWPQKQSQGFASFLAEHELSLIIDQRYTAEDMMNMVRSLVDAKVKTISYDC